MEVSQSLETQGQLHHRPRSHPPLDREMNPVTFSGTKGRHHAEIHTRAAEQRRGLRRDRIPARKAADGGGVRKLWKRSASEDKQDSGGSDAAAPDDP